MHRTPRRKGAPSGVALWRKTPRNAYFVGPVGIGQAGKRSRSTFSGQQPRAHYVASQVSFALILGLPGALDVLRLVGVGPKRPPQEVRFLRGEVFPFSLPYLCIQK